MNKTRNASHSGMDIALRLNQFARVAAISCLVGIAVTSYAAEESPSATPATIASPPQASAASPEAQNAADKEQSLVSLLAGGFVAKRPSEWGEYQSAFNLLDERLTSNWATKKGVTGPQEMVVALPEKALLKTVEFSSGSVESQFKGCSAKDITVEMSDTSATEGFQKIAEVALKDRQDNQRFPVSAEVPGRWVRVTVQNNHGSEDVIELTEFRAFGTQLTQTPFGDVSGTYQTDYAGLLHIKQEGTSVAGCYEARKGEFDGGIEGRVVTLTWRDNTGGKPPPGSAIIVFAPDRKQFFSLWWGPFNSSSYGQLSLGTKKSDEVGSCPQWPSAAKNVSAVQEQMTQDLEEYGRVRVYGIHFDSDSDKIKDESKPTLDKIVAMLKTKSEWKMTIEGHTDSTSTPEHNQGLSERRAGSVKNYLQSAGIEAARLSTAGYGQTKPVAPNDSPIGRAQNRRVELTKQ